MIPEDIERAFKTTVGEQVRLVAEGEGRYRVFTPFVLDDGDHLAIVLKHLNGRWVLTDEGHTLMQMAPDEPATPPSGRWGELLRATNGGVMERDGEFVMALPTDSCGDVLRVYIHVLLAVSGCRGLDKIARTR